MAYGVVLWGDCLEIMAALPSNSIDMIFTDPPYGHNNNNGDLISRREAVLGVGEYCKDKNRPIANDGKEANDLFRAFLNQANRVLKPGACCCCCCCGGGPDPQFARWSLWMDEVFDFKQMVVWDKGSMGMGWHYRRSYEVVLVAQKQGAACKWYDNTKRVENIIRDIRKIIPSKDQHPTEKPINLPSHFIKLHSAEGDIILDPFCGSGSTLESAHRLCRHYIGIDIDPLWVSHTAKRLMAKMRNYDMFRDDDHLVVGRETLDIGKL